MPFPTYFNYDRIPREYYEHTDKKILNENIELKKQIWSLEFRRRIFEIYEIDDYKFYLYDESLDELLKLDTRDKSVVKCVDISRSKLRISYDFYGEKLVDEYFGSGPFTFKE